MALDATQNIPAADLGPAWRIVSSDPAAAERAAEHVRRYAPADPKAALLLAAARWRLGDVPGARDLLAPLIAGFTTSPVAWFEWGSILAQTDQDTEAVAALERAAALDPGLTGVWRALGDLLMALGSGVAAGQAYACAARARTRDAKLVAAASCLAGGQAASAEMMLKQHVRQAPADLPARHLLAEAAMRVGRVAEAEAILDQCLKVAPNFADARHSLAILLCGQQKYAQAAPHLRALLDIAPHQPSLRVLLAACLTRIGDYAGAAALYEAMLAASPGHCRIWLKYGDVLKALGQAAAAARAFRTCIDLAPQFSAPGYLSLADLKTIPLSDAEIDAMRALLAAGALSPADAAQFHYALGHALEQRAAYAEAFGHFSKGAALRRADISYDGKAMTDFVAAATSVFTADFFIARRDGGSASDAAIFVVGLPRSGTTLVEQILASHPQVEGASELAELGLIASELRRDRAMAELPAIVASLDAATRTALGERYLRQTAQFRPLGRPRFTDKMPENCLHTGLIHAILPHARIIDVRRAPMAAGLALFRQYFRPQENGPNFTYDLAEIGRYYRDYVALMAHFATVLPGVVHRVRYEELVEDTEAHIRALLHHCGLPFDPACLRFWETARPVTTPSAQQVRRPIFRDGIDQWRQYEPWLKPLRDAL